MENINSKHKEEREEILKSYAKIWQIQLHLEYKFRNYNVSSAFKGVGAFGELFAATYFENFKGSGSGGSGMDLINLDLKKEIEVKTAVTFQPNKCKNPDCLFKFSGLFDSCTNCGEQNNIDIPRDSRFGINAKVLLEAIKKQLFYKLIGFHIYEKNHNKKTGEITFVINAYDIVSSDSKHDYFINQNDNSKKSTTTNLLPLSYDFYRLNPKLFDSYIIKINYKNINEKILISNIDVEPIRVPFSICIGKEEKELFKSLPSYDETTKTVSVEEFSNNFKLRKKHLNKDRGTIIKVPLK